jgi:hypothetical protein
VRTELWSALFLARVAVRLWQRNLAKTASVSQRAVTVFFGIFMVVAIVLSATVTVLLSSFFAQLALGTEVDDERSLLRLVFAGSMFSAVVYQLVLTASVPSHQAIENVLAPLPVSRRTARAALQGPPVLLGFAFTLLLGLPSVTVISRIGSHQGVSTHGVLSFLWACALVSLLVPATFHLVRGFFDDRLHVPAAYAAGLSVVVNLVIYGYLVGQDLLPRRELADTSWVAVLLPGRAVVEVTSASVSDPQRLLAAWCALVCWTGVAALLVVAVVNGRDTRQNSQYTRTLVGFEVPHSSRGALLWMELLAAVRLPQFVVVVLAAVCSTVAVPLLYHRVESLRPVIDQLAVLAVVVPSGFAVYSFGATKPYHWLARSLIGTSSSWIVPKLVLALVLPLILVTPFLVAMALVGMPGGQVLMMLGAGVLMSLVGVTTGLLVPFSVAEPLSATISAASAGLVWTAVTVGGRWGLGRLGVDSVSLATALTGVALLAAYLWISLRLCRPRELGVS